MHRDFKRSFSHNRHSHSTDRHNRRPHLTNEKNSSAHPHKTPIAKASEEQTHEESQARPWNSQPSYKIRSRSVAKSNNPSDTTRTTSTSQLKSPQQINTRQPYNQYTSQQQSHHDTAVCTSQRTYTCQDIGYTFTPAASADVPNLAHFCAFNTTVDLLVYADPDFARVVCAQAKNACRMYESLFSRTLPTSDVARINNAGVHAIQVDLLTYELLKKSLYYCQESLGLFDITMGTVTTLWNFQSGIVPEPELIRAALSHVDWRNIELASYNQSYYVRKKDAQTKIDLGGTAKGFIADKLSDFFKEQGILHFLLNLGGNVVAFGGKPQGDPFKVGIKNPQNLTDILAAIPLTTGSIVTSGLYERAFIQSGKRYCHILDPQTGMPIITDAESATLVAPKSSDCDGFSTTLCALGIKDGIEFARKRPEINMALFIDKNNLISVS